jgi:hypothetical protein
MRRPQTGQFTVAALQVRGRTPGYFLTYDVDGVVSGAGIDATAIHRTQVTVRERDRLYEGQIFPATYDVEKPERCVVNFPSTKSASSTSKADRAHAAQRLADDMNASNESFRDNK